MLATAAAYRGSQRQPYSPLNHWVSELGEEGVSRRAGVFNAGAIVGGICLAGFMSSLGAVRRGRLARHSSRIGVAGGVAGALVGAFPMNRIVPHAITSVSFFNLTALAIALASVDFARRPDARFGPTQAGVGLASTAAFIAFAIVAAEAIATQGIAALEAPIVRQRVSLLTTLEWASLIGIMAWVLATAIASAGAPR